MVNLDACADLGIELSRTLFGSGNKKQIDDINNKITSSNKKIRSLEKALKKKHSSELEEEIRGLKEQRGMLDKNLSDLHDKIDKGNPVSAEIINQITKDIRNRARQLKVKEQLTDSEAARKEIGRAS